MYNSINLINISSTKTGVVLLRRLRKSTCAVNRTFLFDSLHLQRLKAETIVYLRKPKFVVQAACDNNSGHVRLDLDLLKLWRVVAAADVLNASMSLTLDFRLH